MAGDARCELLCARRRVIEVDFENLDALDMDTVRSREGLPHVPWTDTCESQLAILEAEMRKRL